MWSRWAVQVTKGEVVTATTSLPLRWHCLWLNHLNHFDEHPFVLRHIVGAIRTCLLNLPSTSQYQSIDVAVDILWWLERWNGSGKSDSWHHFVYLNISVSNSNGNDMVWWCKVLHRYDDTVWYGIMTDDILYNIDCSIPEIPRYCNQTVQPL